MKLKIVQIGDPVLREKAKALTKDEIKQPAILELIELMKTTMRDAPGVGLAAPQVGVPLQIAVIEDRPEYWEGISKVELQKRGRQVVPFQVIINPKLTLLKSRGTVEFYEGCLSVGGLTGLVPRALAVKVEALNEQGEPITIQAQGWYARILQHEIDHLHGVLNIDKIDPKTLTTLENYRKFILQH